MEAKIRIALIAIAAVAVIAVAGVGVSTLLKSDNIEEDTVYSTEISVKIDDGYKTFNASGKNIKDLLKNAFGDDVDVSSNGNVRSYKGISNDSTHSWAVFRFKTPDGWIVAEDKDLVQGASLALEFSEKTTVGGKVTYVPPTLKITKDVWFFIQIPSYDEIEEAIENGDFKVRKDSSGNDLKTVQDCFNDLKNWLKNAGIDRSSMINGFWIKGSGTYMNEALADAIHKEFFSEEVMTVDDNGVTIDYIIDGKIMHCSLKKSDLYGWFVDFFGWGDTQLNNGDWTYWSQYSYNPNAPSLDDSRQWTYNNWALGHYDMDLYRYIGLVLQTTTEKDGGQDTVLPTPATIEA